MKDPKESRTYGDQLKALLPGHADNPLLKRMAAVDVPEEEPAADAQLSKTFLSEG
jgi:hypothetical protein